MNKRLRKVRTRQRGNFKYAGVIFSICPKCIQWHHLFYTQEGLRCKNCVKISTFGS